MRIGLLCVLLALAGCGSISRQPEPPSTAPAPEAPRRGAYYKDDGPGDNPPANLAAIPDAVPRPEPAHRFANRPYQVFGKDYTPIAFGAPYRETGIGSWYGRRFHGSKTSSGEVYDMYAMTAAHPTMPIPSYARVTNLSNGRSVVVRINDRGPFHADRIVDLSYAAAFKLGYADAGSARVQVERIFPGEPAPQLASTAATPAEASAPVSVAPAKGIFLQLGAFGARETADNFRVRVYRELSWLADPIHVLPGPPFRLQLGPYRSQEEARAMADRIQSELNLRPVLVVR